MRQGVLSQFEAHIRTIYSAASVMVALRKCFERMMVVMGEDGC
jgi:hypothetical protein